MSLPIKGTLLPPCLSTPCLGENISRVKPSPLHMVHKCSFSKSNLKHSVPFYKLFHRGVPLLRQFLAMSPGMASNSWASSCLSLPSNWSYRYTSHHMLASVVLFLLKCIYFHLFTVIEKFIKWIYLSLVLFTRKNVGWINIFNLLLPGNFYFGRNIHCFFHLTPIFHV